MGGGNGAFAAAADLTLRGFEVTLYVEPRSAGRVAAIRQNRTIRLEGVGDAVLRKVTTNLASALRDEDYWTTGRTLEKVGLDGMTKDEMRAFVMEGYPD